MNHNRPTSSESSEKTAELQKLYQDHWRTFLERHASIGTLIGFLAGGAICILLQESPTLLFATTFAGFVGGLIKARHVANFAPCDLTDWQIALLPKKTIVPFDIKLIEPDSYDVTLADEFLQILPDGNTRTVRTKELVVQPGECWLAHTKETFHFPDNLKGILQGKSSWARLSLFVECAGLFDKGFKGTAVLELYNAGTWGVLIKEGDRIAQMSFHRTLHACAAYGAPSRNSHYQTQEGAYASWLTKQERVVAIKQENT